MTRLLPVIAACAWIGAAAGGSATAVVVQSIKAPEQALCPDPAIVTLVRCPGPHEITTQRISCTSKQAIDDCAQWVQGERK